MTRTLLFVILSSALYASARPEPVAVPFDFSRGAIDGRPRRRQCRVRCARSAGWLRSLRTAAGQIVTVRMVKGMRETRAANIGNQLFAAMELKMLLDYRGKQVTFFGDCGN